MRDIWLTALAIRTLEDAHSQSLYGAVERTWGHRLALSFLLRAGIAQDWQVHDFWRLLPNAAAYTQVSDEGEYLRSTTLSMLLHNWSQKAGLERIDLVKRAALAEAYAGKLDRSALSDVPVIMCNRAERGETKHVLKLFGAKQLREFNEGPIVLHPKSPGPVIRMAADGLILQQMTWGFPVSLPSKRNRDVKLKPKPVNNARND